MRRLGLVPLVLLGLAFVGGCAYFNSLYNAQRLFSEAEEARRRGNTGSARARYEQAIQKAARSYRSDPEGRWADDALLLMGQAYLHRGEWTKARGALRHVLEVSRDEEARGRARLFLGATDVAAGDPLAGVARLDSALIMVRDPEARAEGHLWRARGSFRAGRSEQGFEDLDALAEHDRRLRVTAEVERLRWAIEVGDTVQAIRGAHALMGIQEAEGWADSLGTAAERLGRIWGPGTSARLLEGAESAPWSPPTRNRLILRRARLAAAAGDTASTLRDVRRVSSGVGAVADEARVLEARVRLPEVRRVEELDEIRTLLLPAVASREATRTLEWIKRVVLLVEQAGSRQERLALFAAGELARDSLGAPRLAGELFRLFAQEDRGSTWEGKALLAALQLSRDPEQIRALEGRLDSIPENIYVQAAHRSERRELDYTVAERRLETALANIRAVAVAEARQRDVLVSDMARTLDSIRTAEEIRRRLAQGDSALLDSLRADSIRQDSLRMDSIRAADSLARDTALFRMDSLPPDTTVSGPPAPELVPYRPGPVPGTPSPALRGGG